MGLNTCPSDGVPTCVQSPRCMSYDSEKKSSFCGTLGERYIITEAKVETISERTTLMEEHATTVLKITSQQDRFIRENFTSYLKDRDTDHMGGSISNFETSDLELDIRLFGLLESIVQKLIAKKIKYM
ncbi:hypothetical protein F8M41_005159 [Gigaspora margarita]|uniref:Uncharacterized protein n=1 Tax=Gigaspora margarita TaxID=4874 RepID=A0A8H3X8I2_GIGMA|nr:hypothetical protein F8M41_005159 [Gigaspora margarita]